jgi:dTDP-glucose 4,6-dehydratase
MSTRHPSLLITGGAGFIGSNFVCHFLEHYPTYHLVNLDKLTYAGNLDNLKEINDNPHHTFIKGDICDQILVNELFKKYDIRGVIHFAAESHVDNSILNPFEFVQTNAVGTLNLLNAAKIHWLEKPHLYKESYQGCRFHHISTDEVYGELGPTGTFKETDPYAPNSPYSASKASSDFLVHSYAHTYGLNTVISNCSNNYGPKQHDEKLIPTIIRKALNQQNIPIYGKGTNVRDWLYVEDHVKAIIKVYHHGKSGENYNIGANCEQTNLNLAHLICNILDTLKPLEKGLYKDLITFVEDRPGHDFRYAIDAAKISQELNWAPQGKFEDNLRKTVIWYLNKYSTEGRI